ncbi:MAG: radical SAM protein [Thermoguttaceae bacterium]
MLSLVQHHPRQFRDFSFVYPVISRRSGGLSIGINLSPTARCNFACVYCQILAELNVTAPESGRFIPDVRLPKLSADVNLEQIERELRLILEMVKTETLFHDEWFSQTPPEKRVLQDIAFSGDGEPTLSPQFSAAVEMVTRVRTELGFESAKIVLITNGTTLHSEKIQQILRVLVVQNGEIWAKFDAGTPEHFHQVARSTISFETIVRNLSEAARQFPLVIQTCLFRLHETPPSERELQFYLDHINSIHKSGGHLKCLQIYTVARQTPEKCISPLSNEEMDHIVSFLCKRTSIPVAAFYAK